MLQELREHVSNLLLANLHILSSFVRNPVRRGILDVHKDEAFLPGNRNLTRNRFCGREYTTRTGEPGRSGNS